MMKFVVIAFLFCMTAGLLGGSFYLSINNHSQWGYFLGAGVFAFLLSAACASSLVSEPDEEEDDHEMEG